VKTFDEELFDERVNEAEHEARELFEAITTLTDPECYTKEDSRLGQIAEVMGGLVSLTTAVRKLVRAGRITQKAGRLQ